MATLATTGAVDHSANKVYYTGEYSSDHWAMQPYLLADPKVVALAYHADCEYAVYVNPTDKRGYRCIARFIKNGNMASTVNREYTSRERIGLGLVVQLVADVYSRIVPIAQTAVAGNNAHKFDKETGITFLGHPGEPNFLHGHIFGRGNPDGEYVDGVKLGGPTPGEIFDMRAKTPGVPGNDAKAKWGEGEMEKVVTRIRTEIERVKSEYEAQGLTVITQ
jgi:hypothetical protein